MVSAVEMSQLVDQEHRPLARVELFQRSRGMISRGRQPTAQSIGISGASIHQASGDSSQAQPQGKLVDLVLDLGRGGIGLAEQRGETARPAPPPRPVTRPADQIQSQPSQGAASPGQGSRTARDP